MANPKTLEFIFLTAGTRARKQNLPETRASGKSPYQRGSGGRLCLFAPDLVDDGIERAVKTFLERLGGLFDKEIVPGNMDFDFDNLVLDLMDNIVELEIYIGFDDAVMILVEFGNLLLHMAEQLGIGFEMQGLDIHVHRKGV